MNKVTVTGKMLGGQSITSYVINNVANITIDMIDNTLLVNTIPGAGSSSIQGNQQEFDITAVTTITDTIAAGQHTLVFS